MTLYFEDVVVGQDIPPFQRKTGLENFNRFAAVNDEFMQVHMDDEAARLRGEKGVYGMGNLRFAYFHCVLRTWIGDEAWVQNVACQHRGIVYKDDTLRVQGKVEGKREAGGEHLVDVLLWVENQHGDSLDTGKATVVLPSRIG